MIIAHLPLTTDIFITIWSRVKLGQYFGLLGIYTCDIFVRVKSMNFVFQLTSSQNSVEKCLKKLCSVWHAFKSDLKKICYIFSVLKKSYVVVPMI